MTHPFSQRTLAEILVDRGYLRRDDAAGLDMADAALAEELLRQWPVI